MSTRTRASSSKRLAPRLPASLPQAFKMVPIKVRARSAPHSHVVGAAGGPACPPASLFWGYAVVGGVRFCIYWHEQIGFLQLKC